MEPADPRRQPMSREGDIGAHRYDRFMAFPENIPSSRGDEVETLLDDVLVGLPGVGELKSMRHPMEQRLAQMQLEQAHVLADAGLRHVQLTGRLGEAQMTRRRLETLHPIEIGNISDAQAPASSAATTGIGSQTKN
jgi:hypothetical protein